MKKMNAIPLFISLFLMISCTNQEQLIQEQTNTVKTTQENEYLSAQQLYFSSTVEKIAKLKKRKAELVAELESGNKDVIQEIESIQKMLETYNKAQDYFFGMVRPKGPKGPVGPMPPVPCLGEEVSCNPIIAFTKAVLIGNNKLDIIKLVILDAKGNEVGRGIKVEEIIPKQRAMLLEVKKFEGQATMVSTLVIEGNIEITLETPVRGI